MITFYHIADIERFYRQIDGCAGKVLFAIAEDQTVDIRQNCLVKKLLADVSGRCGVEKLSVQVECADDRVRLLRYMMESKREGPACNPIAARCH